MGQCAEGILRLEGKPNKALDQGCQTQSRQIFPPVKHESGHFFTIELGQAFRCLLKFMLQAATNDRQELTNEMEAVWHWNHKLD